MAEELKSFEDLKGSAVDTVAAPAQPQRDAQGRSYATGRRKDAVARVWVMPGSGKFTVNGRTLEDYFPRPVLRMVMNQPFSTINAVGQFDVI